MLISQQPCGKVRMARVRRLRLAQGQVRQMKSNKEKRYVIKVMKGEQFLWSLVRESQRLYQAFSLVHN
jgi:hypothetical protein